MAPPAGGLCPNASRLEEDSPKRAFICQSEGIFLWFKPEPREKRKTIWNNWCTFVVKRLRFTLDSEPGTSLSACLWQAKSQLLGSAKLSTNRKNAGAFFQPNRKAVWCLSIKVPNLHCIKKLSRFMVHLQGFEPGTH